MTVTGKIFKVGTIETGEGKNGEWQKQQVVLECENGKYTKKVALSFWNDLTKYDFKEDKEISVEVDIESREYNGKWYTDVKAWKIN